MLWTPNEYILEVLSQLPSEFDTIEYKEIPYNHKNCYRVIETVIAMLNSDFGIGHNKFIIFGIVDKTLEKRGLGTIPMQDDNEYQNLFDKINPRPDIQTGTIEYEGLTFGYIFISKANNDRIYEVKDTFAKNEREGVFRGQAFLRRGSKNYLMTHQDRIRIIKSINQPEFYSYPVYQSAINRQYNTGLSSTLLAAILGAWDENNNNDIKLIEEITQETYQNWIQPIRDIRSLENTSIQFSNGVWKIKNRSDILKQEGNKIYDSYFEIIKEQIIKVLTTINPRYNLEQNQRFMAEIYNKKPIYSHEITHGLSEFLAILGNKPEYFTSCTRTKINNYASIIIREILKIKDWKIWATLSENLSLLAEAAPEVFLRSIEMNLKHDNNPIQKFLNEGEIGVFEYKYGPSLFYALSLIACNSDYFTSSCQNLFSLAAYSEKALSTLTGILLPWFPQTSAVLSRRKSIIGTLQRENNELGWKLIISLLPGKVKAGNPIERPRFLPYGNIPETISTEEYWEITECYFMNAMEAAEGSADRIAELIEFLDNVPKILFEKLCDFYDNYLDNEPDDQFKYIIWDKLLDFIAHHKSFPEAKWALPEEAIKKIEAITEKYKPIDITIYSARLFKKEQHSLLIRNKGDWKKSEKELSENQLTVVKQLFENINLFGLLEYAHRVDKPEIIGRCLANLSEIEAFKEVILKGITSEDEILRTVANNYIIKKFSNEGIEWVYKTMDSQWPSNKNATFLALIPLANETLDYVKKKIEGNESIYWNLISPYIIEIDGLEFNNYVVSNLINVNKIEEAIDIINGMIEKSLIEPGIAIFCLNEVSGEALKCNDMTAYNISKIIGWLQKQTIDHEIMLKLEWKFLRILDDSSEINAKTLYQGVADNPDLFINAIEMIYKPRNKKEECEGEKKLSEHSKIMAEQYYYLLSGCKIVPGSNEEGLLNIEKFEEWVQNVKEKSKLIDRFEVAMITLGKLLYYSPADPSGFFIHKNIAVLLQASDSDRIREGYRTEAINSRGVHSIDKTGKADFELSDRYQDKANLADDAGYSRFATTLRQISKHFKEEGFSNIEECDDL
ncbi:ATP-binding protein [Papillibacter cinnamivorans]|uniref:Putative DNA-binding domain-containing protein n=1 Tax=Papillibacter cinnamivorans DSM 12816 TaxID=1122930 RepID=A0A1W2CA05_9FIRM|nr:ATP-binding protein [Papillibacter cinnamivorans]SMC81814.1 Putative DNA-binding domain-containing protein [Papillibacter cinnamivorans DSM 12816]